MFIIRKIFFDTETTGLDCEKCRIIELAMLIVEDNEIAEYDEFIDIGDEKLDSKITELTGITDDMLDTEGVYEEIIAEDLKKYLTPGTLMIAHNCQFDMLFIYHLLERHYPDEAYNILEKLDWIDTVTILKDRKDFPHKLIDAVNHYDIEEVNFHRAIDDTKALYDVYMAMDDERADIDEYINIFGYNPKWGVSGEKFSFITYKSQPYHNRGRLPQNETLPRK